MTNTTLMEANGMWANMPPESRFWTVREMHAEAVHQRETSLRSNLVRLGDLRVETKGRELAVIGSQGVPAILGNYPAQQLTTTVSAPWSYLRTLPPTLAAQNLNHGLSKLNGDKRRLYMTRREETSGASYVVRSFDGDVYNRVYNADMTERLLRLESQGWQVPPARPAHEDPRARPATEEDVLAVSTRQGLAIHVGEMIAPAGLYLDANTNMFAFMVQDSMRVKDGSPEGLARGFFLRNTEVCGLSSWELTTFLYRFVCGNHIVWDAEQVVKTSLRHVGRVRDRLAYMVKMVTDGLGYAASRDEDRIKTAQAYILGSDKDEVLNRLFGLKIATKTLLSDAWEAADANYLTDGSPASAWGFAQGLTRVSQKQDFATDRAAIDSAAGKVLEMVF